jgi:hypothetical protein
MDVKELYGVAVTAVRRKVADWSSDPTVDDEAVVARTSAVLYDLARMKVCVEFFLDSSTHSDEVKQWAGALDEFGYDPGAALPDPVTYWPRGLTYRLSERLGYLASRRPAS